jgi:hypothetical protein
MDIKVLRVASQVRKAQSNPATVSHNYTLFRGKL